jgi:hypothetical protein
MRVIEFAIPEAIPTLNRWQRMHWALKRKTMERLAWLVKVHAGPVGEPVNRFKMRVIRRSAASKLADPDNLIVKPLMDVLVERSKRNPWGLGLIVDDGPEHVADLRVEQTKVGSRNHQSTWVRIEEVDDADPSGQAE